MKKSIFLFFVIFTLQSCYYPVKKDYGIYSKSLVFAKDQKWLVNTIRTDVDSHHKEMMDKEVLKFFNEMSDGNAYNLNMAKSQNIILNTIPFEPENEDLETLKTNTDFNFLVNISTIKVRKDLDTAIGQQIDYKKNETFAVMEVYDIQTMKKIYSFKASSEASVEKEQKATIFTPTTEMMTMKNFNQLLKSIKKNAVKS
ncbi:hypothetical protein M2347_002446 [Chryseobacterium sp. H1D6B]|uniref:hypothetical protein n=1 Tax=Chryseobacterium sp. H1D6B TaxID=2940588 RepID=UPI0015C6C6C1|nr:hypothetical protein [Chryseobacterium sp. H1D6B]MDH6252719.1 hypothetical protein [Chryseobacterium sp. H1D6B]